MASRLILDEILDLLTPLTEQAKVALSFDVIFPLGVHANHLVTDLLLDHRHVIPGIVYLSRELPGGAATVSDERADQVLALMPTPTTAMRDRVADWIATTLPTRTGRWGWDPEQALWPPVFEWPVHVHDAAHPYPAHPRHGTPPHVQLADPANPAATFPCG